jgi:hypothetical protein
MHKDKMILTSVGYVERFGIFEYFDFGGIVRWSTAWLGQFSIQMIVR